MCNNFMENKRRYQGVCGTPLFFLMFTRGITCDFLFASTEDEVFPKKGSTLKERIFSKEEAKMEMAE